MACFFNRNNEKTSHKLTQMTLEIHDYPVKNTGRPCYSRCEYELCMAVKYQLPWEVPGEPHIPIKLLSAPN